MSSSGAAPGGAARPPVGAGAPSSTSPPDDSPATRVEDRVDLAGRIAAPGPAEAVTLFLTEAVGVPAPVVGQMRRSAEWAWFERFAGSLPYDVALSDGGNGVPVARLARIEVPTLVLDGANSPAEMRAAAAGAAAAVPGARYETLPDEDNAVLQRPATLVPLLRAFPGLSPRRPPLTDRAREAARRAGRTCGKKPLTTLCS